MPVEAFYLFTSKTITWPESSRLISLYAMLEFFNCRVVGFSFVVAFIGVMWVHFFNFSLLFFEDGGCYMLDL